MKFTFVLHVHCTVLYCAQEDPSLYLKRDDESALQYAARIFTHVYTHDLQRLASIKVR